MNTGRIKLRSLAMAALLAASAAVQAAPRPFTWDNATVYFVVTDRFSNGDKSNDLAYGRKADAAPLRGFMGGDLKGLTAKVKEGYFDSLGVDAIWLTPPVEQIHAGTDEGTGKSYGFHGYWARDFTAIDANLGTEQDFADFVQAAHARGIRVVFDVVMNHIGPVTEQDPVWPADWVRLDPVCKYKDTPTTVPCALVPNLPDLRTDSNANVALPPALVEKWKKEGRYEREVKELDEFFARTGYPRAPRYYLMKWHADWVRKYGIDGFRADTVKHTEPGVWKELRTVADAAYQDYRKANPGKALGEKFFAVAEVYGYGIGSGRQFDMGDAKVDFHANGFDSLINFALPGDAKGDYESIFAKYAQALHGPLKGYSVLNYMDSHDDGNPFDAARTRPFETANKLLLAPGAAQIYYGDETARRLDIAEATGDAKLRSFMNWDDLANNTAREGYRVADVRAHWSKLGLFRRAHAAVGAGTHRKLADRPYTFARTHAADKVVVALDVPVGKPVAIAVGGVFADGSKVRDAYSGVTYTVGKGVVRTGGKASVVLLEAAR